MARPIRIQKVGGWYHITARGNEGRAIYRDDRDRRHFCELLAEMAVRFSVALHAFVLMDNHYHLLLSLREPNLARALQWLNTSYSVWFNRRHRRQGHLFQGRYKSIIVDPRGWGLCVSRYIHLNPVRTERFGLNKAQQQRIRIGATDMPDRELVRQRVEKLRCYRWSSYRAYTGLSRRPEWLDCASVLKLGGGATGETQSNYRKYVESAIREGLGNTPWEDLKERVVLGSQEFVAELRAHGETKGLKSQTGKRSQWDSVKQCVEKLKGLKWSQLCSKHADDGRDMAMCLGQKLCGLSLKELTALMGATSGATISMAIKRFETRLAKHESVRQQYETACQMLNVRV
jgi:putative transposase